MSINFDFSETRMTMETKIPVEKLSKKPKALAWSMVQNDEQPRFRDIFKEMAENSSLHGIPKIVSSKQKHLKLLWFLLVLVTTGYLTFQVRELFTAFYEYPVKTQVELKFNRLEFPAVSFCNMNPIKATQFNRTSKRLQDIINGPFQSTKKRRKRSTGGSGSSNSVILTSPIPELTESLFPSESESASPGNVINSASLSPWPSAVSSLASSAIPCSGFWACWDYDYPTDGHLSLSDLYDEFEFIGNAGWNAPKSKWQERVEQFKVAFQNETIELRTEVGHDINDMLMDCTFDTKMCFAENFSLFHSVDYGNCYTISQPLFITTRTGPLYGLELTINIENVEYITNFATGYGLRLVIHEQGTFPFPAEEGLTLNPGYETTIGLRLVTVKRMGSPYGDCDNGVHFKRIFGIQYSRTACIQFCIQQYIVDTCGCISEVIDSYLLENKATKLRICNPASEKDFVCEAMIKFRFESGNLKCVCESPCEQKVYEKIVSGREWPHKDYLKYGLLMDFCEKNLSYAKLYCDLYNSDINTPFPTSYEKNFLRVIIYYEDLNYELISESPLYDGFRFLSDIGGTLGLFMGASVLSFVEALELIFEIVNYFRRRIGTQNNRIERVPNKPNNDSTNATRISEVDQPRW